MQSEKKIIEKINEKVEKVVKEKTKTLERYLKMIVEMLVDVSQCDMCEEIWLNKDNVIKRCECCKQNLCESEICREEHEWRKDFDWEQFEFEDI